MMTTMMMIEVTDDNNHVYDDDEHEDAIASIVVDGASIAAYVDAAAVFVADDTAHAVGASPTVDVPAGSEIVVVAADYVDYADYFL